MRKVTYIQIAIIAIALAFTLPLAAQSIDSSDAKPATVVGTVTDINGDPVPDSTVVLSAGDNDRRTVVTPTSGFFEFHDLKAGISYDLSITANDFQAWTSNITLEPGQFKIVSGIQLRIRPDVTQVRVNYDPIDVATEQLKVEENQRVLGFIPNFYVTYEKDPAPLTTKMKFRLALKVSKDPVTLGGISFVAASRQAADTSPNFGQGWDAYGKRVGAIAADGFSDIMIGGAILPSLLHQDPRYFYQGTGTTGSRMRHAAFSPFITRSDKGNWMPNYSSIGGDLASSALSNLYYPRSDRGLGLIFGNFAIGTAERIGSTLAQEFLIGRFTRRAPK
jgi:hypothetical protein